VVAHTTIETELPLKLQNHPGYTGLVQYLANDQVLLRRAHELT